MRSGSNGARWRELFLHRNGGLVGLIAKKYRGKFHGLKAWDRRNQKLPTELDLLLSAGRIGLEKAVDKFDLSRGNRFSTPALYWIKGEMTALFKESKRDLKKHALSEPVAYFAPDHMSRIEHGKWGDTFRGKQVQLLPEEEFEPRCAEDYLELRTAVEQALIRLNDPRKYQIMVQSYGLFPQQKEWGY